MKEEKKDGKSSLIIIVVLLILVLALGGYIGYDKFFSGDHNSTAEGNSKNETNAKNEVDDSDDDDEIDEEEAENGNYVKTRSCIGVYSGSATISQDAQTGKYSKGTLTIELKVDGTYELRKENMNGEAGTYTIIDNALLLTTSPHTCGPDADCSAKYSHYLDISEDCAKISRGYGSSFFDPNFTLNKQ